MKNTKLKQANTWPVKWHAKLIDTGYGSGDLFIELPDDLLNQLGWKLGDVIEADLDESKRITLIKLR